MASSYQEANTYTILNQNARFMFQLLPWQHGRWPRPFKAILTAGEYNPPGDSTPVKSLTGAMRETDPLAELSEKPTT